MPNDIVVQSDKNGGKVHLSADRVYDLNKNKTQDVINAEFEPLMQLDSEVAIVIDGRSCTLGAVSGQYVILQNSTIAGKTDGLYTVATGKTIPIGTTNVTADMLANPIPRGGLNHLNESVKNTLSAKILKATTAITPSTTQQTYSLPGLTINHELIRWNFVSSGTDVAENSPPCDLTWETGTNIWKLTAGSATSVTCQPVFAIPE